VGREWEKGTIAPVIGAGPEVVEANDDDGCEDDKHAQSSCRERHCNVVLTRVGDRSCARDTPFPGNSAHHWNADLGLRVIELT
jgi:hypothetical protein